MLIPSPGVMRPRENYINGHCYQNITCLRSAWRLLAFFEYVRGNGALGQQIAQFHAHKSAGGVAGDFVVEAADHVIDHRGVGFNQFRNDGKVIVVDNGLDFFLQGLADALDMLAYFLNLLVRPDAQSLGSLLW